jgi:anthranilate synthase/phosphoribosyltransferase
MYLLIDNYDSFTYNLYALCLKCGVQVKIIKHNEVVDCEIFAGIIISPGPSAPSSAGRTLEYIEKYKGRIPILGICLGMQAIGQNQNLLVHGAKTVRHGKLDAIEIHSDKDTVLYRGFAVEASSHNTTIQAVRYHSLAIAIDASSPRVTSTAKSDGEIMSYEDREQMLFGVQYHPESFLSEGGEKILKNFFEFAESNFAERKKIIVDQALAQLWNKEDLTKERAKVLFDFILDQKLTPVEVASILLAIKAKGEAVSELLGALLAMDERKRTFPKHGLAVIDTCGTGGSGKSGMNISTAVAVALATLGHAVVKHGNRAQSGLFGSADLLEELGVMPSDSNPSSTSSTFSTFSTTTSPSVPMSELAQSKASEKSLLRHGFAFLFAPLYHPALKPLAAIRREMRAPSLFNLLGPLVNPANCDYQIIGTPRLEVAKKLAEVLSLLKRHKKAIVYSSRDGHDEVSSCAITDAFEIDQDGKIQSFVIDPKDFFVPFPMPVVSNKLEAKELFLRALEGREENLVNLVALNGALGLRCLSSDDQDLHQGFCKMKDAILAGEVGNRLSQLIAYKGR